ncbi:hypothetical protein [Acidocella aminolytica]|uniref:Uncharacterized protein n=1 Tax=Acidocella aminolytica 101 = DSM 11237 TaxID=1120923 RepID=A0A0D6PEZ9_9PROT|nr:hypothetical protein [Acidocella aminolytica]GAN79778.1 hypothetical protein Aam_030_011 [Acidocella aminolytica 101 = DSM 11237]GBQ32027.1 hypothetical protein AA11237_0046 [Acidocella aminolytica 101 = DSM 11237]SHF35746.1 hypothetical protein SAMN02746095_02954 [Acidocella aminolytica 101 = DSM 11237]
MADISDVANALVSACAAAIYPGGASASVTGANTRVYYGWPVAENLDNDGAAGIVNVSVFASTNMTKLTTRYPIDWGAMVTVPTVTLTATLSGQVITLGGTGGAGQNFGILAGNTAYIHSVTASDTPGTVAAAFAAALGAVGVTASGDAITFPASLPVYAARVGAVGQWLGEMRRQEQGFLVTVFAPTPALRDATAAAIDGALAGVNWLTLADGSSGRLLYHSSRSDDKPGVATVWRRTLTYTVEYATTQAFAAAQLLFMGLTVTADGSAVNMPPGNLMPSTIIQI